MPARIFAGTLLVALAACGLGLLQAADGAAPSSASAPAMKEVKLPAGTVVLQLWVSPKAGKAVYLTYVEGQQGPTGTLVDLRSGQSKDVSKLVPGNRTGAFPKGFSADGRTLLLEAEDEKGGAFLLDLATEKATRIADGPCACSWLGNRVAVTAISDKSPDGELALMQLVDPAGGAKKEIPVRGMVMVASSGGERFVGAANPDDPGAKVNVKAFMQKAAPVLMDAKGTVLKKLLAPKEEIAGPYVISPSGKCLAMVTTPAGQRPGPDSKVFLRVTGPDGKEKLATYAYDDAPKPIFISDSGAIIATEMLYRRGEGYDVSRIAPSGKKEVLVKGVDSACVVDNVLYYVATGKQPILRSMPIPPQK